MSSNKRLIVTKDTKLLTFCPKIAIFKISARTAHYKGTLQAVPVRTTGKFFYPVAISCGDHARRDYQNPDQWAKEAVMSQ